MKILLRGLLFGIIGGLFAFVLALIEGVGGAFASSAGSTSPSPYFIWGIVPVVATAGLVSFIGRREASIAAAIVLGVVLWRCWSGYEDYLKEGGVWAKAAPRWLSLMRPVVITSILLSLVAIVVIPLGKTPPRQNPETRQPD